MKGSGLRKRKRWSKTLPVSLPSVLQWLPLLSSAGPAGGQEMLQTWLGPLDNLCSFWALGQEALAPLTARMAHEEARTRPARAPASPEEEDTRGLQDFVELLNQVHDQKRGHAVPRWSAPRAAWKVCLIPTEDLPGTVRVRRALLQHCRLIRHTQAMSLPLSTSWICPVDKRNGRSGCARFRRIEVSDPIGAAHAMGLWRRRHRPFSDNQYGFVRGQQRLHAVL